MIGHVVPEAQVGGPIALVRDGDVITIEPGIYLPGLGGIRIEDTVAVTGGGGRSLTTTSKALRVL